MVLFSDSFHLQRWLPPRAASLLILPGRINVSSVSGLFERLYFHSMCCIISAAILVCGGLAAPSAHFPGGNLHVRVRGRTWLHPTTGWTLDGWGWWHNIRQRVASLGSGASAASIVSIIGTCRRGSKRWSTPVLIWVFLLAACRSWRTITFGCRGPGSDKTEYDRVSSSEESVEQSKGSRSRKLSMIKHGHHRGRWVWDARLYTCPGIFKIYWQWKHQNNPACAKKCQSSKCWSWTLYNMEDTLRQFTAYHIRNPNPRHLAAKKQNQMKAMCLLLPFICLLVLTRNSMPQFHRPANPKFTWCLRFVTFGSIFQHVSVFFLHSLSLILIQIETK